MNDLDAKIAQLDKPGTTIKDVIQVLGEPQKYSWGQQTFGKSALPPTYIARLPHGVQIVLSGGTVTELRCEAGGSESGFNWHGKLHLGSSLDDVLQVVGPPTETVVGKPLAFASGVLYRDIDGKKGDCYYARPDQNVRFFFLNYRVTALYITTGERSSGAPDQQYITALSPLAIVRQPPPMHFDRGALGTLPAYNPKDARTPWQVDLRSRDLSRLDISGRLADLLHAVFDSNTRFPSNLPVGFDPARIMELGKDPGLGIRELHAKGVTGKGVGIGIIDQTLLVDHIEYRDRLRLYEEIHNLGNPSAMHGPAVASIAVGKTVGVAPESDLYYIAETHGVYTVGGEFNWDFTWLAKSIDRLLAVNAGLPKERRIRVISISVGWSPQQKGYAEVMAAVQRATKDRVFVVSTALANTHSLAFHGLGRQPLADPNSFASYSPGSWWASEFWDGGGRISPGERLLVPMDSRCVAGPTGPEDYVLYADGGWSWCVPWISGLYALACQVKPDITPAEFWAEALTSGQTVRIRNGETEVDFRTIANPVSLIEDLQRGIMSQRAPAPPLP
ncbi:MAG TPA: S8 family serine peptidase [Verrucomicrobiae bacterium]|nr:S8 family serine peptidase [Verrucomicrobiae bacterium]